MIAAVKRERQRVDWLYRTNVHLAAFLRSAILQELRIWWFQDDQGQLHMDLTHKDQESKFWLKAVSESITRRDNFFKNYKEFLPASEIERIRKEENEKPMAISANKNIEAL